VRGGFPRSYLADRERLLREDSGLLRRLVEAGLRGQLKTGSLLTGQLYVELTKVEAFPLEQIGTDLSATLTEVRA
jgi:paraquat-inducible protein B